jgi:hypothetical protein
LLYQCPDVDLRTLFVVYAQADATAYRVIDESTDTITVDWTIRHYSINTTVIACIPSYKSQKA